MRLTFLILTACGGAHEVPVDAPVPCPIGDPTQPAQLQMLDHDADKQVILTTDGTQVPLYVPRQGGYVVDLGARITNIDVCHVSIAASARDVAASLVVQLEVRPTDLVDTGDGWAETALKAYSNLPFCPGVGKPHDLHDYPYDVTVTIEDGDRHLASATATIIPTCNGDPICECTCSHTYVGGPCP